MEFCNLFACKLFCRFISGTFGIVSLADHMDGRFLVLGSSHIDDSYFSRRLSVVANLKAFPALSCVNILTTTLVSHVHRVAHLLHGTMISVTCSPGLPYSG